MLLKKITIEKSIILLGVLSLIPFVILSFYNHPWADDFGYANLGIKLGFLEAQKNLYENFQCRLLSSALVTTINPLVYDWWFGFKIIPVVFIFLLFSSLFLLFRTLSGNYLSLKDTLTFVFSFLFLYYYKVGSIMYSTYWINSLFYYQLANILMLCFFSALFMSRNYTSNKFLFIFLSAILMLGITQTNESISFLMIGILFLFVSIHFFLKRKLDGILIALLCLALLSFLLMYFSPGTAKHDVAFPIKDFPMKHNIIAALIHSIKSGITVFGHSFLSLLLFSILLLPLFSKLAVCIEKVSNAKFIFLHPFFSFTIMIVLTIAVFFPVCWSLGIQPWSGARTPTISLFYLILSWGYFMLTIVKYYRTWIERITTHYIFRISQWICFAILVICLLGPNNIRMAYGDIVKGKARKYDEEMKKRYVMIYSSTSDTCLVPPLQINPNSISVSCVFDIDTNAADWNNLGYASFFRKKAIRLSEEYENSQ